MKNAYLLLALLLCAPGAAAAAPAMIALSSATYDSGAGDDKAMAVATDPSGNIYVTGTDGSDYLSIKYSKTMVQGPAQTFSNGRSGNIPGGIAVDGFGNIIVAGMESNASFDQDYLVLKYSPNFAGLISSTTYDSGYFDRAYAVTTDDQNNIFVTGYNNDGVTNNFYTIKYDSDLVQLSTHAFDSGDNDEAYALALSGSDLVVTGFTHQGGSNYNVRTVIYDKDLAYLDDATFDGGNDERGVGVAVDSAGNIIVAAKLVAATPDFLTLKYDSFLNLISSAVYDSGGVDFPTGVAVDSDDNIIVTGYRNASTLDFLTIRYNSSLTVISTASYDGGLADQANAVAVDQDDNVVVAGQSYGANDNYFTVKYNAAPSISAVSALYIGETANVTIGGKGLLSDTVVSFDDTGISTGTFAYSSGEITLAVTPSSAVLLGVTTITVTNVNGESASSYSLARTRLRTTVPAGQAASIYAMTGLGQISVIVPAGAFTQQQTISLYPVAAAAGDIQQVGEALFVSASTNSLVDMSLTLRYSVADLGGDPESSLSLAYYSSADGWVPVPSSVNTSAKSVTGTSRAAGTKYAVIKSVSTGGGGGGTGGAGGSGIPAKVYPNPYRPGSGGRFDNSDVGAGIVFAGMTPGQSFSLTIVDLAGQLVFQKSGTADSNGRYLWDTGTASGGEAVTGVYIYFITGGGEPVKGKFAIIR